MKTGRTLVELAQELQRQRSTKVDYDASSLRMEARKDGMIQLAGQGNFGINSNAHSQFADKLNIPKKYYDTMRENAPELWATNLNYWFKNNPKGRKNNT